MKSKTFGIIITCLLLVACSDPKNYKLPEKLNTISKSASITKAIEKLGEEDKKLFGEYTKRAVRAEAFGKQIGNATTIGEAINIQRAWMIEQTEKQANIAKKKQEADAASERIIQEMNAAITLYVDSFAYMEEQWKETLDVGISFANNSDSEIKGIKGELVIRDMFGAVLKKAIITTDTNIRPGKEISGVWSLKYNQFDDGDETLKNADATKLTFGWNPKSYIFTDGKNLTMPN